ncbi:MAG: D-aminoacylase [Candidatus Marinimicrobia bacterium]|nr:D-aminoacylase [Candidatus Neomarinimicrobiota bacterium]
MSKKITRRSFLKTTTIVSAGVLVGSSIQNRFDIIIRNGSIHDGLGNPASNFDLGIIGNRIVVIDNLSSASADRIIDATGLAVTPGFIDIHTHTDIELIVNPRGESKIRQGITTEIGGNCGSSPFPMTEEDRVESADRWFTQYGFEADWNDIPGFYNTLKQKGIGLNYGSFTGHGDLRAAVIGRNDIQPAKDQLFQMRSLLEKSIEHGSLGLSTGLEYSPGSYAKTEELIELCRTVSKHNGVYATHMRNEDDHIEEALEEALRICRETGVSTQISHLKVCNKNNWHKVPYILEMLDNAAAILPVKADRYPYDAWGTGLSSMLPLWSRQGSTEDVLTRLKDYSQLDGIAAYAEDRARRIGGWDQLLISNCKTEANKIWEGKSIQECAEEAAMPPFDFVRNLLIEDRTNVGIVGFAMNEENLKAFLKSPHVMVGSDGSTAATYGALYKGKPHPRYYGTFPRVLGRYVRDEKTLELPEAIKMMTSMPAEKLNLKQRGSLQKGNFADITIFNPATVIDNATFADPHQYPTGIDYVIVNGKVIIDHGEHSGALAGQLI